MCRENGGRSVGRMEGGVEGRCSKLIVMEKLFTEGFFVTANKIDAAHDTMQNGAGW